MTLPAWDQSDGVVCPVCGDDFTLCEHGNVDGWEYTGTASPVYADYFARFMPGYGWVWPCRGLLYREFDY